jgi:hypothetical protein
MTSFQITDLLNDPILFFQGDIEYHRNGSNSCNITGMDMVHKQLPRSQTTQRTHHHRVLEQNVTVEVSGSRFCIVPSLFKKVENLKWKKSNGIFKLNANPDVFEMILQYFLCNSLPDTKCLSHRKATELMELVAPLEPLAVLPLCQHVQSGLLQGNASTTRDNPSVGGISSTFLKRSISGLSALSSRSMQLVPGTTRRVNSLTASDAFPLTGAAPVDDSIPPPAIPSHVRMMKPDNHMLGEVIAAPTSTRIVAPDVDPFALLCDSSSITSKSFSLPPILLTRDRGSSVPTGQQYPTQISTCDSSSEGSISKLSHYSPVDSREVDATLQDENSQSGLQSFYHASKSVVSTSGAVGAAERVGGSTTACNPSPKPPTSSTLGVQDRNIKYHHTHQSNRPTIPSPSDGPKVVLHGRNSGMNSSSRKIQRKNEMDSPLLFHQRRPTNLIRSVLKGGGSGSSSGDNRSRRKMTHADWCSSEYVL